MLELLTAEMRHVFAVPQRERLQRNRRVSCAALEADAFFSLNSVVYCRNATYFTGAIARRPPTRGRGSIAVGEYLKL